ncbi:MAG TPA: SDR family oxidoreductase [Gemmatimonadaceae bacterium]|nr:SDR family oxidoreductase [Gemmatimonadaceae bacterium]
MNTGSLEGRVAVVTGAAGLLGRQHAMALSEAGARVVLTDLDEDQLDAAVHEVAAVGGPAPRGILADVTDPATIHTLRDWVLSRWQRLDILVNNAALNDKVESPRLEVEASKFEHYPLAQWRRMMDVNVTGVFLPSQILGCEMAARGSGSIINVASTYGLVGPDPSLYIRADGTPGFVKSAAYPASKGAVLAFTRFLAAYWGHAGVRVNALVPGGVENGQDDHFRETYSKRTPLGRMAGPHDYRGAIVFLAGDSSSYMTGATLVVDGGFTAW